MPRIHHDWRPDLLRRDGFYPTHRWAGSAVDALVNHLQSCKMGFAHTGHGDPGAYVLPYKGALEGGKAFAPDMVSVLLAPHWFEYALAWLPAAREYFGGQAYLYSVNAFWLVGAHDVQGWHRDEDADQQMAVFMFGTDTTPTDGGHEYQRGSHLVRADDDLDYPHAAPPPEVVASCWGPRGTVFVEDPRGLHRGRPSTHPRLLVWARYCGHALAGTGYRREPPASAELLGGRYPSDANDRESVKLVVA